MPRGEVIKECDARMVEACKLLIQGESKSDTAKILGVNRKTLLNWESKDCFKKEMFK